MSIILTSTSAVKIKALERCVYLNNFSDFHCISTDDCGNVEQPVGIGGIVCCKNRVEWVREHVAHSKDAKFIVSIENAIEQKNEKCFDVTHILVYDSKLKVYHYFRGGEIQFPREYWDAAYQLSIENNGVNGLGWSITVGDIFAKRLGTDPKNWIGSLQKLDTEMSLKFIDRADQICDVLQYCFTEVGVLKQGDLIKGNINYIQNYPKRNVLFQDLSPVFANFFLFNQLMIEIDHDLRKNNIYLTRKDYVVGLESRGFVIGGALASKRACGFVMIRKKGKLPPPTLSCEYEKEYGTDSFEIQENIFPCLEDDSPPIRMLIVDDLLATGGSLECAVKLIQMLPQSKRGKIEILGCYTLGKVDGLEKQARERLSKLGVSVNCLGE